MTMFNILQLIEIQQVSLRQLKLLQMKTIVITGGAGFLGEAFFRKLFKGGQ